MATQASVTVMDALFAALRRLASSLPTDDASSIGAAVGCIVEVVLQVRIQVGMDQTLSLIHI